MPGRSYNANGYRFGFNGQEKDDEVFGSTGTSYTAEFWQYDSRIGRRWNIDPVVKPWESSYAVNRNNPIALSDPFGDCPDCDKDKPDAKEGDIYRPKGADLDYVKGKDGEWTALGGSLPEAEVIAEKTQKSKNHVWSAMNMYSGNNLGKGVHMAKYGNGLDPWQEKVHQQFMAGIHTMSVGLGISLAVPAVVMAAPIVASGVQGNSIIFSTELWGLKAAVSASSQALFNEGRVNMVGVVSDAITMPGFSGMAFTNATSSMFEANFNIYNARISTRRVLGDKSFGETAFQFGTGMLIGTKLKVLNSQITSKWTQQMIEVPNSFATEGLNKSYDLYNKE
jgi:hypothetical protein